MIATGSMILSDRFRYLEPMRGADDLISNPSRLQFHIPQGKSGWLQRAFEQISAIADLKPGWDSQGADPPDETILQGAVSLLLALHQTGRVPKPHIHPARSGGVQFEWENGPRYFEIELVAETRASFFYSDAASQFETSGSIREGDSLEEVTVLIRQVAC
ncbi:MAG TPA: hypothetical protein VMP01_21175 [Pirellulaceae bacterium]|nr:hypothetical protein [Pirellulaceae bacterium]